MNAKKFFVLVSVVVITLLLSACSAQKLTAEQWQATQNSMPTATVNVLATTVSQQATQIAELEHPTTTATTETPAPTATTLAPTAILTTQESTIPTSDNNIVVNGTTLGVVDPQMQQVHAAALYLPTGISGHNVWNIQIPSNGVLIVGGTDVNGIHNGVYQAWAGGQTVTVDVTNGFALVTLDKWSNWEFCFRVSQAVQYGWAHGTVSGIPGWAPCQ